MKAEVIGAWTRLKQFGPDRALMISAGILVCVLGAQGVRLIAGARLGKGLLDTLGKEKGAQTQRSDAKPASEYEGIVKKGVLGAAPAPQRAVQMLFGILGDTALIGSSWQNLAPMKVGDQLASGEKIVEIGTNSIVVEKDGNRRVEKVFDERVRPGMPSSGAGPQPPGSSGGGPGQVRPEAAPSPGEQVRQAAPPDTTIQETVPQSARGRRGG